MRLILLTGLIVLTFVFGFLFAHEPFRNAVIRKTIAVFSSEPTQGPAEKPAAQPREARRSPSPAERGNDRPDKLTEKDRRALDDLLEEVEE